MSEAALRQWRLYIDDVIVCGEQAVQYASGFVPGAAAFVGANDVKALDQRVHRDIVATDPLNKCRVASTQPFGRPDQKLFDV
jgi:hypothetical protein